MTFANNILFLGDRLMEQSKKELINYKDSFESLYLRHDYLKRIKEFDESELKQYEVIVKATSALMYEKYKITYNKASFYYDDIVNIGRVYLYAYLGLYSLKSNPTKLADFKEEFKKRKGMSPTEDEVVRYERNNIINFLRQKFSVCSISCDRKSRNIVVGKSETKAFAFTDNSIPASNDLIIEDPKLFGYRVVKKEEMKEIKKIRKNSKQEMKDKSGFKVFEIEMLSQIPISLDAKIKTEDGSELYISDNIDIGFTPSVESSFMAMEDDMALTSHLVRYESMNTSKKKDLLRNFINHNSNQRYFKNEIKIAKKLLKNLDVVVL